jgi:hypothetical protein
MKSTVSGILAASIFARGLLAEFTYQAVKIENGVETPVELTPLPADFKFPGRDKAPRPAPNGLARRSNPLYYDYNWCGAVQSKSPGTFTDVFGQWYVPKLSLRSGQTDSDEPYLYQWVGLDGWACQTGLLQTGTGSMVGQLHYCSGA